jgi:glycosyltransferase involved in cell wall biosynthesis
MQRLTLCMIVKNEERFLDGCLSSVAGVADAIVVVDTGSTDRTVEIARKHGATVVTHVWNDDFAAARNAALEQVKSGFVLVLDADERLGPGAKRALRKALSRDDFDCGMLPLHDASRLEASLDDVVQGRARRGDPVLLPRLLRRTSDLAWEGVIHEQVTGWARRHRRIVQVDAPIVHFGAVPELRAARGKNDRNLSLLERRAAAEPNNATVHAYLARELERRGDAAQALEVARRGWACFRGQGDARPELDVVLPATLLAFLALRAGELDEALATLAQARLWSDPHPNFELLEGLCHERRAHRASDVEAFAADLLAARSAYEALRQHRGKSFWSEVLPGALGATGATRLGTVYLLLAEPELAERAFAEALLFDSELVEAKLGLAEALLDSGRPEQALRGLPELLAPDCADAWVLGAAAAAQLGSRADACMFVDRAREALNSKPWIADHRLGRLQELECELSAAIAPAQACAGDVPSVSVVIPAYNRLDLLRPVLEGFARQTDVAPFELIVVDDGSLPPVRELFDELVEALGAPANWRLIEHERNRGRGAALNSGLDAATGDVVIFCDSDIEPSERFVAEHLAFHIGAGSELATCLGALEYGVDAGLFGAWMGARSNPRLRGGSRSVDWTQWFTDNWSFRRTLLASRGLRFDERHRVWGWEELDLAFQLQKLGATNHLLESARGRHLKAASVAGMLASFARSTPNLDLLASKLPSEPNVRGWTASRAASREALERVSACLDVLWSRLQELDAAAPERARDVGDATVNACAIALSDLVFRVGITRGYVEREVVDNGAVGRSDATSAESNVMQADRLLDGALGAALRAAVQFEARLGALAPASDWRRRIASLLQAERAVA